MTRPTFTSRTGIRTFQQILNYKMSQCSHWPGRCRGPPPPSSWSPEWGPAPPPARSLTPAAAPPEGVAGVWSRLVRVVVMMMVGEGEEEEETGPRPWGARGRHPPSGCEWCWGAAGRGSPPEFCWTGELSWYPSELRPRLLSGGVRGCGELEREEAVWGSPWRGCWRGGERSCCSARTWWDGGDRTRLAG